MKQRLRKLVERARHRKLAQWSLFAPRARDSMAWLPTDSTGWTVHRDVALRLKNLSIDERGALGDDPGSEAGAFKIRLAGHPEARREAGALVRQRYSGRGYPTSATARGQGNAPADGAQPLRARILARRGGRDSRPTGRIR